MKVTHFHVPVFENIMKRFNIEYSDILKSLDINNFHDIENQTQCNGGKSGAFFLFTPDQEFILKTATSEELELLNTIIKDYSERIISSQGSLLAKIFCVFKIKFSNSPSIILILMENLKANIEDPLLFDMKGSSCDRQVSSKFFGDFTQMPTDLVYKDTDFIQNIQFFSLNFIEIEDLVRIVEADTQILEKNLIMDYSLFVVVGQGVCIKESLIKKKIFICDKAIVTLGIIDFLQGFNLKKKLESKYKNFGDELIYSAVPPKPYRNRFLHMIRNIFRSKTVN